MSTGLVLIHGRSHQLARPLRRDPARVDDHIAALTRGWMAGLAKGLTLAGRPPIAGDRAFFSFYGNAMADSIDSHESRGGRRPELELDEHADEDRPDELTDQRGAERADDPGIGGGRRAGRPRSAGPGRSSAQQTADALAIEAARHLGFAPDLPREASRDPGEELDWSDALRVPVVTSALQFLARKTGTAGWIIEDYLTDVAYYLAMPTIRAVVQAIVGKTISTALDRHDSIVIISHSLGTVVAYDALTDPATAAATHLLVTAGAPLGLPVVQKHLLRDAGAEPGVPALAGQHTPRWINAYDVRDIVALVHPLAPLFTGQPAIHDVTTFNPSGPHSIEDYLSDPDVAGPVSTVSG